MCLSLFLVTFGELLRDFRERANFTQEKLAQAAALNSQYVNKLERGVKRSPMRRTVLSLAAALRLSWPETNALLAAAGRPALGDVNTPGPQQPTGSNEQVRSLWKPGSAVSGELQAAVHHTYVAGADVDLKLRLERAVAELVDVLVAFASARPTAQR